MGLYLDRSECLLAPAFFIGLVAKAYCPRKLFATGCQHINFDFLCLC
jgi:hypothetical protein